MPPTVILSLSSYMERYMGPPLTCNGEVCLRFVADYQLSYNKYLKIKIGYSLSLLRFIAIIYLNTNRVFVKFIIRKINKLINIDFF